MSETAEKIELSFEQALLNHDLDLQRSPVEVLQINNGKLCNQACLHCHVEAGPKRTELMSKEITARILELLDRTPGIHTVDITGGAPEMNPHFRWFVEECISRKKQVIDRCNLTIFFEEGYEDLPEFLARHQVTVVASLPCYSRDNVDKQRGRGVFDRSIRALLALNELGYGHEGSSLELHLVYNPLGASLPPCQETLQADYKRNLMEDFGISFNQLFTITNMPIKRFLHQLHSWGKYEQYMELLVNAFNPHAARSIMCRNLISVSWTGEIFDCDFNQMLELPVGGKQRTVWDLESFNDLGSTPIAFGSHCFGCTAGAGSSCSGTLT